MLLLLFLFRLGSLENIVEASEHMVVWGARKVMEENLSHELLRQYPHLYFLRVYRITVSENTSCPSPFLSPEWVVPFLSSFYLNSLLFVKHILPFCLLSALRLPAYSQLSKFRANYKRTSLAMPLQRDERFKAISRKINVYMPYYLTISQWPNKNTRIIVKKRKGSLFFLILLCFYIIL